MSQVSNSGARIEAHSSRLWAFLTFKMTRFILPARIIADQLGISTVTVTFWLTPWARQDEHLPMSHIAEVTHDRGLIWDEISVESSGGINPLTIAGLPKGQARVFVEHVRQWVNAAPRA